MASPEAMRINTSGSSPLAITTVIPQAVAILAAWILVNIPPTPSPPRLPPARENYLFIYLLYFRYQGSFGCNLGSAVYSPEISLSIINRSASIRLATIADRLSLSPNFDPWISSIAITSFSLMMLITPTR
jgi:hypothetical protein